jgi:hypothetical protein
MELLGIVMSSPVLRNIGNNYVVEWARENGCPEPYARPNVFMYWCLTINSFMCKKDNYVDYHNIS